MAPRKIIKPHLDNTVHTIDEKDKQQDLSYGGNIGLPTTPTTNDNTANRGILETYGGNVPANPTNNGGNGNEVDDGEKTTPVINNTDPFLTYLKKLAAQNETYYNDQIARIDAESAKLTETINANKEAAITYAEGQKLEAEEAAKIQRERDMVDAANAYEKNKATYGAKAEALADMGLTGGGYSDYIDAQAYAAQRGDVQAAKAREAESNRLATNAYNDAVYKAESEANSALYDVNKWTTDRKDTASNVYHTGANTTLEAEASYKSGIFNDILDKISSGTISADQIDNLANMYGMNDEQKQVWLDAASKYGTANTTDAMYNIDRGAYYSTEALDRMEATKEVSPEDRKKIEEYQTKAINNRLDYYFTKGDVASATAEAEELYASKLIDQDKYQETYFRAVLKNIQSAESSEEVEKLADDIDNLLKEGKLTSSDAENLKKYLDVAKNGNYSVDPKQYVVKGDKKWWSDRAIVEYDGERYEIYYGNEATSKDAKKIENIIGTSSPKENSMVVFDGRLYLYREGYWYWYTNTEDLLYKLNSQGFNIPIHTK